MIEIGRMQTLKILRIRKPGAFLGAADSEAGGEESVLLPGRQIPEGAKEGDSIEVFVYLDSSDRKIATTARPAITLDSGLAVLTVKDTSKIGAFLDWGLEKDLFLPFKEQSPRVRRGDRCLVRLYVDRSGRLCASMKIYDYLSAESPYQKNDEVKGFVYRVNPEIGVFVAVDEKYYGMVPIREVYDRIGYGEEVTARVTEVRQDGKLNLSLREKAYLQIADDADTVMKAISMYGGVLPFSENSSPELIRRELHMSKGSFKRALGHLLKEKKIEILPDSVRKI